MFVVFFSKAEDEDVDMSFEDSDEVQSFERSFICKVYDLFNMIPQHLKVKGLKESWSLVMKDGQRFISSM